jgi:hypothetical protein
MMSTWTTKLIVWLVVGVCLEGNGHLHCRPFSAQKGAGDQDCEEGRGLEIAAAERAGFLGIHVNSEAGLG